MSLDRIPRTYGTAQERDGLPTERATFNTILTSDPDRRMYSRVRRPRAAVHAAHYKYISSSCCVSAALLRSLSISLHAAPSVHLSLSARRHVCAARFSGNRFPACGMRREVFLLPPPSLLPQYLLLLPPRLGPLSIHARTLDTARYLVQHTAASDRNYYAYRPHGGRCVLKVTDIRLSTSRTMLLNDNAVLSAYGGGGTRSPIG